MLHVICPLLETSMEGARGVLLSIAGPSDMSLHEVNTAASLISEHSDADFSHSICPDCYTKLYPTLKSPYEEQQEQEQEQKE